MLALWSRATRSPGACRCTSCVSGAVRRAGVGGTRGSLMGTATSTSIYTTIFAAGLARDAKPEPRRNQQWETTESMQDLLLKGVNWDTINNVAGMEVMEDEIFERRQSKAVIDHIPESFWNLLPYDSKLPDSLLPPPEWPANTGPDLIRHHLPPQSLWSPLHMRWTAIRKRQSWKKLAIQELSISVLIHALLQDVDVARLPEGALKPLSSQIQRIAMLSPKENIEARKDIREAITKLRALTVDASIETIMNIKVQINEPGIPSYHQDSDGDFYEITKQLNTAVQNLFRAAPNERRYSKEEHFNLTTAKICHNLLISTAAPDLQTFNLLLAGYRKRGHNQLVNHVIGAFDVCKIRPNEITCSTILDHYIRTDQPEYFSRFVARMRGVQNALMLAKADININEMGQGRLVRKSDTKVYQKVHPTPVVFGVLMLGVLKFAGFERAVDIYFEMKDDGWGLDTLGLCPFLTDCVTRADFEGGLIIWQEITSIKQRIEDSHMSKAYSEMLALCSLTGNTVAFNQLLKEVVRLGYDRKRIMGSAVATARKAQDEAQKKRSNIAPAWAADNLLIAVSEYMNDRESAHTHDNASPTSEFNLASAFEDDTVPFWTNAGMHSEPADVKYSRGELQPAAQITDPEEAWAAWMAAELGEPRPTKSEPSSPDADPNHGFGQP